MALDNANYIAELSISDPPGSDPVNQGDDHIRTTKRATQQTFPNFVSTTASPDPVTKTEAQINDLAEKSATQSISGTWTHAGPLKMANNVRLVGRNAADDSEFNLARVNTSDEVEYGSGSAGTVAISANTRVSGRVGGTTASEEVVALVAPADGSVLVRNPGTTFLKAGFRNPRNNNANGTGTAAQSWESSIRTFTSTANITLPQLEEWTQIAFMNDGGSNAVLTPGSGVTMKTLLGGTSITGAVTLAPSSFCVCYWLSSTQVKIIGNGLS